MRYSVLTLFPDLIDTYTQTSIIGRARQNQLIHVETINPRDFTSDPYRRVDDTPYGGGAGMVMMCKPLLDAYNSLTPLPDKTRILMTSPIGRRFNQSMAEELSTAEQIVLICGHYEGVDARIELLIPNLEHVSIGDYVLTGGELAAMAIIDSITRLLPGVLGNQASLQGESFSDGVLTYPQYTRPSDFEGLSVPEVLRSGNHAAIESWRRQQALKRTLKYRPDLLEHADLTENDWAFLESLDEAD